MLKLFIVRVRLRFFRCLSCWWVLLVVFSSRFLVSFSFSWLVGMFFLWRIVVIELIRFGLVNCLGDRLMVICSLFSLVLVSLWVW